MQMQTLVQHTRPAHYLGWAGLTESLQPLGDTSQDILSSGVTCGSTHLHSMGLGTSKGGVKKHVF